MCSLLGLGRRHMRDNPRSAARSCTAQHCQGCRPKQGGTREAAGCGSDVRKQVCPILQCGAKQKMCLEGLPAPSCCSDVLLPASVLLRTGRVCSASQPPPGLRCSGGGRPGPRAPPCGRHSRRFWLSPSHLLAGQHASPVVGCQPIPLGVGVVLTSTPDKYPDITSSTHQPSLLLLLLLLPASPSHLRCQ